MTINWDLTTHFFNASFQIDVQFNNACYKAIKYAASRDNKYTQLGLDDDVKFELMIDLNDFATPPAVNDKITVDSVVYRVLDILDDSRDITRTLFMGKEFGN